MVSKKVFGVVALTLSVRPDYRCAQSVKVKILNFDKLWFRISHDISSYPLPQGVCVKPVQCVLIANDEIVPSKVLSEAEQD